jgi:hypothetical protein
MTFAVLLLGSWLAQAADPARAPLEPPGPPVPRAPIDAPADDPANGIALAARYAHRFAAGGPTLEPTDGFSLGASLEHRYAALDPGLAFGIGLDLFHDRFSMSVPADPATVGAVGIDGTRVVSQTSFTVLQTAALTLGRARLFTAIGGGVTVGFFSSPEHELLPGSSSAVQPLARGAAGFDVRIRGRAAVAVRADYTHVFTHPTFVSEAGQSYHPFGDLFDVGVGLLYRF